MQYRNSRGRQALDFRENFNVLAHTSHINFKKLDWPNVKTPSSEAGRLYQELPFTLGGRRGILPHVTLEVNWFFHNTFWKDSISVSSPVTHPHPFYTVFLCLLCISLPQIRALKHTLLPWPLISTVFSEILMSELVAFLYS